VDGWFSFRSCIGGVRECFITVRDILCSFYVSQIGRSRLFNQSLLCLGWGSGYCVGGLCDKNGQTLIISSYHTNSERSEPQWGKAKGQGGLKSSLLGFKIEREGRVAYLAGVSSVFSL